VDVLPAPGMPYPHPPTVSLPEQAGYTRAGQNARPAQLAWLTDDMLKASTRSGGIAARLK
jgi:hypothetical protein